MRFNPFTRTFDYSDEDTLLKRGLRMGWRISPSFNGLIYMLGWYRIINTAESLTNATPVIIGEPGYHSHIIVDVSGAVGTPFNIVVLGRSIDVDTGVEVGGDTEIISVIGDGYYQTTKSWLDAVTLSVGVGPTCIVDIYRVSYWDRGNNDFTLTGVLLEVLPGSSAWAISLDILKVNNNGSLLVIDNINLTSTDPFPVGAKDVPGKYKRGNYNTLISGAERSGLILRTDTSNLTDFYVELKYDI